MKYSELKQYFELYHQNRLFAKETLDWVTFELWNIKAKIELAAMICMWQRAGAMI